MKFPRKSLAIAGAVAMVSIGTAAYAGPPFTISVGGSSTGGPASYGATSGPIAFTVPGQNLACSDGTADGTITPGSTASKAGEITSSTFNNCDGPLGIPLDVTQTSTWDINIDGNNVGGVTPGSIGSVTANVSNPGGLCEFDITGLVGGSFNENNQQLAVSGGGLTVSNVSGCFGLILDGDPATFDGTYQLANIANVTIAN